MTLLVTDMGRLLCPWNPRHNYFTVLTSVISCSVHSTMDWFLMPHYYLSNKELKGSALALFTQSLWWMLHVVVS